MLVIHSDSRSIRTYDVETGKEASCPLLSVTPIWTLAAAPDGKTVLGVRKDGDDIVVWETGIKDPVRRLVPEKRAKRFDERQVAFLPDGRRAVVTDMEGTINLWDVPTGRLLNRWEGNGTIVSLAVSPDGCWALCGLFSQARAFLFRLPDSPE